MGSSKLNFIDLFSGAGGFSCGLEMAGLKCLLGVDHDQHAMNTFAQNHHHANIFCGDICKLDKRKLNKLVNDQTIHLVVGGPPCQGFSTAGRGDPADVRNKLFMQFVRIVKELKPHYVMVENVTGLVAKKNESTLAAIFTQFRKLGYQLDVRVMAAHKYNVPEKRRRTIIIGSRINSTIDFPKEQTDIIKRGNLLPAKTVGEALLNLSTAQGKTYNHDLIGAKIPSLLDQKRIKRIPEGKGIRYQVDEKNYLTPKLSLGVNWEQIPEKRFRQTKYLRLDRKSPSPTIMTHRHTYFHPTEHRYLTQREAAAIQSFPNDFIFTGPLSAQWRQIGNAVPPLLAKELGKSIKKMFRDSIKANNGKIIAIKNLKNSIKDIRSTAFNY